ncbi:MAG TPA: wax ester/triacylglycerol synthase family O-acyltransferase [Solirubrobacteraceae bacterium]|jgi:WS/DGAT/MGAT family acyltransferase|nr:wax ester/triacylglycerol synthase family O-acyltransferase [Solirubrobacteraceae bacterium]
MPQEHLDRLTAVDASFLEQETPESHMHVGALVTLEGPAPPLDDFLDLLRGRLHLVPRYRQKLAVPPLDTGRPLWVDDPDFNLEYHVRHSALPSPGSEEQLRNLAARIFSQQLDRSKPLWELWVVEGLDDGCWALISKTHHAVIDGIAGVDLATVMFDLTPVPREVDHPPRAWRPHREPAGVDLVAAGVRGAARTGVELAERALGALLRPQTTLAAAREAAEGLAEVVWAGLNPAPETPLNVPIGPHRRFAVVRGRLADFKLVKDVYGGTVNDVVLTVVSGGLRTWLRSRGVRTEGLELRALVPVSLRRSGEAANLGNDIAAMRGPLPVYIADPVERLRTVRAAMGELKESKQALGAEVLASLQNFAPPTILGVASRLNFSTRLFNCIVTNVPGPQVPLYVLGREMQSVYPIAFLPRNHAVAVAIISYNGWLNFGLLGDYDAMPDLDSLASCVSDALDELVGLARAASSSESRPSVTPV